MPFSTGLKLIILCFSFPLFGQQGKILSKKLIDLSSSSAWEVISNDDNLNDAYLYLNDLNFYRIQYLSDSLVINGMIIEPKKEGKYPAILFNRGGNRNFAPLNLMTLISYTSRLAKEGYVILASNYREEDEFGGKDVNDVINLIHTVGSIEKADTSQIGMFGWSRGGMMTYLILKNSDKIKTAVIGNGPSDLIEIAKTRPVIEKNVLEECIPGYLANKRLELEKRSAIHWPTQLDKTCSLLILAGTLDKRVSHKQAVSMAEELKVLGRDCQLKLYETDHFFSDKKKELQQELITWFNQKLN